MSKEILQLAYDELKHIKAWCLRSLGIGLVNENVLAVLEGALARLEQEPVQHWSDCAVHSEPAYPKGECDCGGYVTITKVLTPLTDEQLTNIITSMCNTDDGTCDTRAMCRAIESAHGIKGDA